MSSHIYLAHHGIKGMKWGVRRFRNEDGTLTEAGKKRYNEDGSRKTHRDKLVSKYYKKGLSQSEAEAAAEKRISVEKKIAIGAAVVTSVALIAYGSHRLSSIADTKIATGKSEVTEHLDMNVLSNEIAAGKNQVVTLLDKSREGRVGRSADHIDSKMVGIINAANNDETGTINCAHTSMAYILNSVMGKNVTAKGFNGVDEVSGLFRPGRNVKIFDRAFDGINHIKPPEVQTRWGMERPTISEAIDYIPRGSTGILFVNAFGGGHFMNYERSLDGALTLIDSQDHDPSCQVIVAGSAIYNHITDVFSVTEILDCSNATIRDGASNVLRYCIQG